MAYFPAIGQSPMSLTFSDDAWLDVLSAVDRTYAELIEYQERLEQQNSELKAMRGFLTAILGSVSDVLIVVARTGEVEQVSQSLANLTGRPIDRVVGCNVTALFDAGQLSCLTHALEVVLSTRRPAVLELRLVAQGTEEPIDLSIAPRFDDRSRVAGFVLTGRPLATLRKAYAELQASHEALKSAQAQLVRNEKLASLGRLLAGVAHELNNPISFVYANTHAMERYASKFEQYFARVQDGADREELVALRASLRLDREVTNLRAAIDGARDGAERVRDIVEDLRRLSSEGSGDKVSFDLVEVSRVAANWVLRGMKTPVELRFDGVERVEAFGRPGHVQQIVMNLVQNAVDALEGRADGRILLRHSQRDGVAVLEVVDNGPGVSASLAASIFDPFFTTKPVGKGTGLGLSISHKIAEEHGGRLMLCDDVMGGCFRLELPSGERS